MNKSLSQERISEFLDLFDAYAAARAQLRCTPEEGRAEQDLISHCLSLWRQLCERRKALEAA